MGEPKLGGSGEVQGGTTTEKVLVAAVKGTIDRLEAALVAVKIARDKEIERNLSNHGSLILRYKDLAALYKDAVAKRNELKEKYKDVLILDSAGEARTLLAELEQAISDAEQQRKAINAEIGALSKDEDVLAVVQGEANREETAREASRSAAEKETKDLEQHKSMIDECAKLKREIDRKSQDAEKMGEEIRTLQKSFQTIVEARLNSMRDSGIYNDLLDFSLDSDPERLDRRRSRLGFFDFKKKSAIDAIKERFQAAKQPYDELRRRLDKTHKEWNVLHTRRSELLGGLQNYMRSLESNSDIYKTLAAYYETKLGVRFEFRY